MHLSESIFLLHTYLCRHAFVDLKHIFPFFLNDLLFIYFSPPWKIGFWSTFEEYWRSESVPLKKCSDPDPSYWKETDPDTPFNLERRSLQLLTKSCWMSNLEEKFSDKAFENRTFLAHKKIGNDGHWTEF